MIYPKSIAALIEQFQKFPSVGPKSAQRMAFQVLKMPISEVEKFANAIIMAKRAQRLARFAIIFQLKVLVKFVLQPIVTNLLSALLRKQKT